MLGVFLIKDRDLREQYKEDWQEGVDAWPGRLVKLVRALLLVGIGVPKTNWDVTSGPESVGGRLPPPTRPATWLLR